MHIAVLVMDDDNKNDFAGTPNTDDRLSALLSTLRREPTPEADFESRFLADFHARLALEPKPVTFMDRVRGFLSTVWRKKAVYGASFAGLCVMCVAYVAWLPDASEPGIAATNVQANYAKARRTGKAMGMGSVSCVASACLGCAKDLANASRFQSAALVEMCEEDEEEDDDEDDLFDDPATEPATLEAPQPIE